MYASNGTSNIVHLLGNVGKDPHSVNGGNGSPVTFFSLATDDSYADREGNRIERTTWIECKAFGKTAETVRDYVRKGRKIVVLGSLSTRIKELVDPADGQLKKFTFLEVEVKEWTFADKRPAEGNQDNYSHQGQSSGGGRQSSTRQQGGHQTRSGQQGSESRSQNPGSRPTYSAPAPPAPRTGARRF